MSIITEIGEACTRYNQEIFSSHHIPNSQDMDIVILISPKGMMELLEEISKMTGYIARKDGIYFTDLGGKRTPIIIRNELDEVKFILMSRREYNEREKKKY